MDALRIARIAVALGLLLWPLGGAPRAACQTATECDAAVTCGPSMDGHFEVNYLGRTFDGTDTTFAYRVCELAPDPDLSHWVVGLGCLDRLVGYSPTQGAETTPNGDPTTCVPGLKWNTGGGLADCGGTCGSSGGVFSFTLAGDVAETMVPAGVTVGTKAGQLVDVFCIQGPDCDGLATTTSTTSTTTSTAAEPETTSTTTSTGETTTSTTPEGTTSSTAMTPAPTTTSTTLGCVAEPEICNNEVDDDCDTLVDCVDEADCLATEAPCRIGRDPSSIRFGAGGPGRDLFRSHGRVILDEPIDVAAEEVGWFLSNRNGYVWRGALIPGDLETSRSGRMTFTDVLAPRGGGRRFGIFSARVKVVRGVARYWVKAYADLSAATEPEMTVQFYIGRRVFGVGGTWRRNSRGWKMSPTLLQ